MSLIKETEKYLCEKINEVGYKVDDVLLENSSRPEFGQFQVNVCMMLAKVTGEDPREIAEKIIASLDERFVNVNIQGPGFINLSFSEGYLINYGNEVIKDFEINVDKEESRTIIVDYGGANAAKALHVGHMRSANIGEAIKRLAKLFGNNVISDVHLGDVGRQSGMVISEIKRRNPDLPFFDPNFSGPFPEFKITKEELRDYYPLASKDANENEDRMSEVREITTEIDKGNRGLMSLWLQIVKVSIEDIKEMYKTLNCDFDLWEGELDSLQYIEPTLDKLRPYMRKSEGAFVIDVKEETDNKEMPPLIVVKESGSSIYATRDLATIFSRVKRFNPDAMWYVVDKRQSLYFEQVFRASYKSKLISSNTEMLHYGFGTINGPDGKPFKTRDGGVMELRELVELVNSYIGNKMSSEISGEEKYKISETLTVATLKFADLLPFRTTDYAFDVDKFSSFEGKTGPYILYTMVRIKSLLNKINNDSKELEFVPNENVGNILVKNLELSKVLTKSFKEGSLSYICEYIYDLCSLYNKFYAENNIMNESDEKTKNTFVALSKLVYTIGENILNILAIEIPDKM